MEIDAEDDHDVCGVGFKHLTSVDDALKAVIAKMTKGPLQSEHVQPELALGRVLSEDIVSPADAPPSDRAAMDGFAVNAEDTYGATNSAPVMLKVIGKVDIGTVPRFRVQKGNASTIVTGGQMPKGADAVVMVEHTKSRSDGVVEIWDDVHPAENVARKGEDVQMGTVVLRKGTRILPQDIGMLTNLGVNDVHVVRKPLVAVLSTGNELQKGQVGEGKVPDVNRPILLSALSELGCEPIDLGAAPDESDQIMKGLQRGLKEADITLVTAGTSVGPEDNLPKIIDSMGKPGMIVHGVAMRPSMPTGLAVINGKPVVSLPGYPVSAYIAFLEFVRPLIDHIMETDPMPMPTITATLSRRIAGVLGSKTYVRVLVIARKEGVVVEPVRTSGAGILSSLVRANGFVIVPENVEGYEEGQKVSVQMFRPCEREP